MERAPLTIWGPIVTERWIDEGFEVTKVWPDGTRVRVVYDDEGKRMLRHYEQDHYPGGGGGSGTLP